MRKIKWVFIITAVVFAGALGIGSYNSRRFGVQKETRLMMDTYVTISAVGPKEITHKAIVSALDRMREISVKFNSLNPTSPIYAFNRDGTPISDPEILGLVELALKVSRESEGAFDITVSPLVELWGFYEKSYHLPSEQQIQDILSKVGYRHLSLNNEKLEKDNAGVKIDLGGIAKGYAISEAIKVLKGQNVTSALIDAGGDIYALGKKGKKLWRVGIKAPRREGILGYVEAQDLAVMSSGDYERFFIKDGKRYYHIFNPKTGYPTEGIASVTLIYPDPTVAQAWAKVPFVLGAKKGLEILESIPEMEAIIVTDSKEILYTFGFKHKLNIIPESK